MIKKIRLLIRSKYKKIKVYYTKHDFDMENPTIEIVKIDGLPQGYPIYFCKNCDKYLCLDKVLMEKLPFTMSHGCSRNNIIDDAVHTDSR